jgi:hypothetical protein
MIARLFVACCLMAFCVTIHAAGMTCWAVRTEYTRGLALPGPEREFESLTEVDLSDIVGVLA